MVERLKNAVEKARAQRQSQAEDVVETPEQIVERTFSPSRAVAGTPLVRRPQAYQLVDPKQEATEAQMRRDAAWQALGVLDLDAMHLEKNRLMLSSQNDHASMAFDTLRTRIRRAFQKHGWTRLGITSPTKGCGKTFVAANLALSFARQIDCRTLLMDMDLRIPNMASVLGVEDPEPITWFLSGDVPSEEHFCRIGSNLALGLNAKPALNAAEVVQAASTTQTLETTLDRYAPDMVIYDLPPMLSCDDVLAFLGHLDCVLLVVGGGQTLPAEVSECERLLTDQTHLLGVLLNRGEGQDSRASYGYV